MRPCRATPVSHLVRPVVLLAVLSLAGRAALVDGQRVLATGWPAPPAGVWVAATVVGAAGAAVATWRTVPLVRRWHRELAAARGEPSGRVVAVVVVLTLLAHGVVRGLPVARLLGRHVVVWEVAPFVVVSGGVSLRVDVDEVEVLGYVDAHHVPGLERVGRHADPRTVDGAGDGRRLHVLPFGTRVDAVGMVERDGAGWRLRGTPARVPGVAVVVRPG